MAASYLRSLALAGGVALLGACAQKGPGPLYMWETFPRQQYETLLRGGSGIPGDQLLALQAHAEKARAAGAALPPGFRAHMGMLKLAEGDAPAARELWMAEKTAFPESAPYMDQLLKRLEAPAATRSPA
ncbi:MAG: DUF4810 domain-containing protein [Rubrivivax sp.]|nr:DUF4810 domain-containing protein [Rubrivivax sp.]